ncbi:MAG TPA: TfoX/Sxy family protein [Magnetospirillaceae bacterium]
MTKAATKAPAKAKTKARATIVERDDEDRRPGAEFAGFVADLFAPLGPVAVIRVFSGHGFKLDGFNFALILRGRLYLRADEALAADLKTRGSSPFKYSTSVRNVTVSSYWSVPEEYLDDADQILDWAKRAFMAAQMNPKKKKKAKPKPSPSPARGRGRRPA